MIVFMKPWSYTLRATLSMIFRYMFPIYVCFQTKVMFPICRICFQSNSYVSNIRFLFPISNACFQYTFFVSKCKWCFQTTMFPMYVSNIHRATYSNESENVRWLFLAEADATEIFGISPLLEVLCSTIKLRTILSISQQRLYIGTQMW